MAVEMTVSLLIGKLKNLLAEKEIIYPGLRTQLHVSIQELEHLQRSFRDAEKKGIFLKEAEKTQLVSSIKILSPVYSADDIVDKFLLKALLRRQGNFIKIIPFALLMSASNQFFFSKQMEKCFTSLKKIQEHNGDSGNESQSSEPNFQGQDHLPRWERIASFVDESDSIIGLQDQRDDLVQLILNSRWLPSIIPVVGVAGSGKTTLVKFIYNSIQVKQHFECCAWISVSDEKSEEKELLIEILKQVSVVREEETLPLEALRKKVRNFLISRTYLIVLDDMQALDVWESLKSVFPNSVHGSRVILTMRRTVDARSLDPWILLFKIRPLNPQESWALFLRSVRRTEDSKISSVREKIVNKCAGLPLTIVTLAGLLSTKSFSDWSKVIDTETSNEDQSSLNILDVSYQDLPSPVKPCLLYSGIFPKSHEIPIRRLFRLWLAEGLATPTVTAGENTTTPEDLVERYFQELVTRKLIVVEKWRLDGSPKTCKVQPALYDNLFLAAADIGYFHVHRNFDYKDKPQFNVRRIAEHLDIRSYPSNDPSYFHYLRSYISFNARKGDTPADEVDKLLKKIIAKRGFGLLTVLDLENVYKPVLSDALGKLLQLKYLGLRWTFLDSVPESIGKLPCLETLDVKHTNIPTLPISIWKAKKLRHLYMNEIHFDMSMQKRSFKVSLDNLQTLWGLLVGNNCSVINCLRELKNLRKLGLTCLKPSVQKIIDWISESELKNLQSLRLRSINEFNEPSNLNLKTMKKHTKLNELHLFGKLPRDFDLNELPLNLKILTLSVSQLEQDPMPILGTLPQVNILKLFARSYLGKEMTSLQNGFTELRVLKLWMLEELEEWIMEEGSMPKLKELEIRCCTNLKRPSGLQQLAALKELTLTNMPEEFVADVKTYVSSSVLIKTKNWNFAPLQK